jgi:hypothetical protein
MKKEILIAIALGIILGLIVTYGVYTANQAITNKSNNKPQTTTIPTPTPAPPQELQLSIATPEDYTIVSEPQTIISGITRTNVIVAIITEEDEYLIESGSDGNFSKTIKLVKGANTITIQASDTNQLSNPKILHIVYSTQFEKEED